MCKSGRLLNLHHCHPPTIFRNMLGLTKDYERRLKPSFSTMLAPTWPGQTLSFPRLCLHPLPPLTLGIFLGSSLPLQSSHIPIWTSAPPSHSPNFQRPLVSLALLLPSLPGEVATPLVSPAACLVCSSTIAIQEHQTKVTSPATLRVSLHLTAELLPHTILTAWDIFSPTPYFPAGLASYSSALTSLSAPRLHPSSHHSVL